MNRYEVFHIRRHAVGYLQQTITEIEMKNLSSEVAALTPELALDKAKDRFPRWAHSLAVAPKRGVLE